MVKRRLDYLISSWFSLLKTIIVTQKNHSHSSNLQPCFWKKKTLCHKDHNIWNPNAPPHVNNNDNHERERISCGRWFDNRERYSQNVGPNLNIKVRVCVEEEVLEERGIWMVDKTTKQRKIYVLWEGEPPS